MERNKVIKTLMATAALGAILALAPVSLDFGGHDGWSVKVSQAFAKDGNSGSDDSGSDDSGSDDGDDNSGSGGGDGDSDGDSSGRDEPRIPGGSGCDDAGDLAEHPECGGAAGGGGTGGQSEFFLTDGTKVEISNGGLNIEVKYPDGSKEEIQFGRYERKDTNNNTVEERSATAEDFARIQAIING